MVQKYEVVYNVGGPAKANKPIQMPRDGGFLRRVLTVADRKLSSVAAMWAFSPHSRIYSFFTKHLSVNC